MFRYIRAKGESPVKCDGKVIVIDGGFAKPIKSQELGGYTLIYNSYGLILSAYEPFTSADSAVAEEKDIVSNRVAVHYTSQRRLVGDTDTGKQLKERIAEADASSGCIPQRYHKREKVVAKYKKINSLLVLQNLIMVIVCNTMDENHKTQNKEKMKMA